MNTIYYPKLFHTLWTNYEDWVRNMPHHHEMNEVENSKTPFTRTRRNHSRYSRPCLFLQEKYHPGLDMTECIHNVERVIAKREVQNAILTGVELDVLAEQKLTEPLQSILETDESLYGVDEILSFAIVNIYGSIGFTNYGYIDKEKPGILGKLNDKSSGECHTF